MDSDVLTRLHQVEARLAIGELLHRYFFASDADKWDELRQLFAEDIEFAGQRGADNVIELLKKARAAFGRTIHTPHGAVIEFQDDDHASGVVPVHAELNIEGTHVVSAMRYFDKYARIDGRWLFAKRSIRYHYALPWNEMAEALTADTPVRWPGAEPARAFSF